MSRKMFKSEKTFKQTQYVKKNCKKNNRKGKLYVFCGICCLCLQCIARFVKDGVRNIAEMVEVRSGWGDCGGGGGGGGGDGGGC